MRTQAEAQAESQFLQPSQHVLHTALLAAMDQDLAVVLQGLAA